MRACRSLILAGVLISGVLAAAPASAQGKPTTAGSAIGAGDRAQMVLDVRKEAIISLQGWARSTRNATNSTMAASLTVGLENGGGRVCAYAEGVEWQGDSGHLNASVSCMMTVAPGRYVITLNAPNKRSDGRNAEIHYIMVEK